MTPLTLTIAATILAANVAVLTFLVAFYAYELLTGKAHS